jgi:hypothetical protein
MRELFIGAACLVSGMTIGMFFCDWMLAEAQSLLNASRELQEDAVRLAADRRPDAA